MRLGRRPLFSLEAVPVRPARVGSFLWSLLLLGLTSCGASDGPGGTEPDTPRATILSISQTSVTLSFLGATCHAQRGDPRPERSQPFSGTISWSTDNPAVVTVDATGLLTAVQNGTATVSATSGSLEYRHGGRHCAGPEHARVRNTHQWHRGRQGRRAAVRLRAASPKTARSSSRSTGILFRMPTSMCSTVSHPNHRSGLTTWMNLPSGRVKGLRRTATSRVASTHALPGTYHHPDPGLLDIFGGHAERDYGS